MYICAQYLISMKNSTTAIAAYVSPNCRTIEIDTQSLVCTSPGSRTEGYGINQYGLNEDDWE